MSYRQAGISCFFSKCVFSFSACLKLFVTHLSIFPVSFIWPSNNLDLVLAGKSLKWYNSELKEDVILRSWISTESD